MGRSPEDATLDEDRLRKVQEAVDQLTVEERRLLELAYFEGMAVREAARELHWHPSKAQRCHEAARKHLHQLLGVDSLDELEIIVGLAAYISLAERVSAPHLPAGVEAVAEAVSRGIGHGWARAQDLARRLPFGGGAEPSATAALGGSAGRAAGVCATAALACLASGVVGPGVGGVNLIGGGGESAPAAEAARVAERPAVAPLTPRSQPDDAGTRTEVAALVRRRQEAQRERHRYRQRRTHQTRDRSRRVAVAGVGGGRLGSEQRAGRIRAGRRIEPSSSESSASSSSSTPTQVANQQFGP